MAAVMEMGRLQVLLAKAAESGCGLAWLDGGALILGTQLGEPRFAVDFAHQALADASSVEDHAGAGGPENAAKASPPKQIVESADAGGRRTGNFALILEDRIYPAKSQRELLRVALQSIERVRPGTLEKLSADRGRTKRPIARDREHLYTDPNLAKYAQEIEGGWWIATNNSYPEVEKYIKRAGFHAGLEIELRRSP